MCFYYIIFIIIILYYTLTLHGICTYRVWRENRDRIVGWYDRFVYWNPRKRLWYYSWDVSCEPSLALTGAAFYHKVISYIAYCMFLILYQDCVAINTGPYAAVKNS